MPQHDTTGAACPELLRLVYTSAATVPVGPLVVRDLLVSCRRYNRAVGVSGLLVQHEGRFMQCLEGAPAAVHDTMVRVRADRRHRDVVVLQQVPIAARTFGSWYLAYATVGPAAWTMLDHVDWQEPGEAAGGLTRGFELLERVWDLYRNTWQADRGPPDD